MTTWTTLSAGAVGVSGIPSGSTVTALRDNPVAIAEGSSGAPRIVGASIHATTAADTFVLYRAGVNAAYSLITLSVQQSNNEGNSSVANVIGSEFTALVDCEIRLKFNVSLSGSGSSTVKVHKEGVDLTTFTTAGDKSYSVSLSAGETVGLTCSSFIAASESSSSQSVSVKNYRITANISSAVRG